MVRRAHSLTEYSHMSAPEVMMGYCARATERIHLGSAIMNLSPGSTTPCATPSGPRSWTT